MTSAKAYVVEAAIKWARALELQAESEDGVPDDRTDAALRQAELELYVAVLSWRAQAGDVERQQAG